MYQRFLDILHACYLREGFKVHAYDCFEVDEYPDGCIVELKPEVEAWLKENCDRRARMQFDYPENCNHCVYFSRMSDVVHFVLMFDGVLAKD